MQHGAPGEGVATGQAIDRVAEYGEPGVGEVDADLVLPTGLEAHLEERRSRQPLADAPVGSRRARRFSGARDTATARHPLLAQRSVDRPVLRFRLPGDEREVAALDAMSAEGFDQAGARFTRQGEGERAGRVAVEAVHTLGVAGARVE